MRKKCSKCKEEKNIDCFSKQQYQCKSCKREYYFSNKEKIKDKSNQRYYSNQLDILNKQKLHYQQNKEKRIIYQRNYELENVEKVREYNKKHYLENKEKYKKTSKEWIKNKYRIDEDFRIETKLKLQIIKYLNQHQNLTKIPKLLGYNIQEFIKKVGSPNKGYDIDHKVPLSWFKKGTPIDIIWDLRNLHIIPSKENRSKGNRFSHEIDKKYKKIIILHLKDDKKNKINH